MVGTLLFRHTSDTPSPPAADVFRKLSALVLVCLSVGQTRSERRHFAILVAIAAIRIR
jgi:hypothetical protein